MFSHEGTERSHRQNRLLAGYLAFVGGFANSAGFVLVGAFTSHVTGTVGRLSIDVAGGRHADAMLALFAVGAFFAGAFVCSVVLESRMLGHLSRAYAAALAIECVLLVAFVGTCVIDAESARRLPSLALLLGAAMGVQNALVTRLSGAVVRTTHLTGVVTDLGIEAARWLRFVRARAGAALGARLVVGANEVVRPAEEKGALLVTIATSFGVGAIAGGVGVTRYGAPFMALAPVLIFACALYALANGRKHRDTMEADRR